MTHRLHVPPAPTWRLPLRIRRAAWTGTLLATWLAWAGPARGADAPSVAAAPPAAAASTPEARAFSDREDVRAWAHDVAERNGLQLQWVLDALAQARHQEAVVKAVLPFPSGTRKNWTSYRSRFVEPRRIRAAQAFWEAHAAWLDRAYMLYGVPQEIVVGLIGVETIYGRQLGNWRALDALATLAFNYPVSAPRDRSAFFRRELEQLLLLCRENELTVQDVRSSYAGALGVPQFMPSSWRRWAVDFDGDGQVDLWGSMADSIGSVAHYLAEHGWVRDGATYFSVEAPTDTRALAELLAPDIRPSFRPEEMQRLGTRLADAAQDHPGRLALVRLENGDQPPRYVIGTENFYAITRYNQSSFYAMAVIELGQAAAKQR